MAFIRNCVTTAVILLCISIYAKAQTVHYPAQSSQLLKATAQDMAVLLQKATPGALYNTQPYTVMPAAGIILQYDSTITDNQACKVESDGATLIKFIAAEDNGLHFGIYQYLHQLGFRFYQPGTIWEIIPALSTAYKNIDTIFTCSFKYKSWFISGGHNRWVMDNTAIYSWDAYAGENGHNWALYQRRNGMLGSSTFKGHRADVLTGSYLTTLQNNPCYVANFNGSRSANVQSVPDIFNTLSTDLWANTIEQKYTQYKNIILNSGNFYINIKRNFNYGNKYIGIEVPDGAKWGNSKENEVCNTIEYPKESDQHFILANRTVEKISQKYPEKQFQLYAYSTHADVPSVSIEINKKIDVQLVPTVYQSESSFNGLRNRWYNKHSNVSEYLYLNLSGWSGETPAFNWTELKNNLQIAHDKKSQGLLWEASPSKFASLPYLLAANANLQNGTAVDISLQEFCNNMFDGAASTIYKMFQLWGSDQAAPDKYKIQMYLRLMNTAVVQTQQSLPVVKERMLELKAFIHYMVLLYDLANNDQIKTAKAIKDAAICIYLAKTNKMQLVNSFYVINTTVLKYGNTSDFFAKYNTANGTAYLNGNLPLITASEIENNFSEDFNKLSNKVEQFILHNEEEIKDRFNAAKAAPLEKIVTFIGYTNGANYYNKTSFGIMAPSAGKFTINYTPRFDMPGKGYINFVVENAGKALEIITDVSIDNTNRGGTITVTLPEAGKYLLSVVSKYKSAVELTINTNGNYFYKKGAFLGSKTESYAKADSCLPGYFYVPHGLSKIYFTITNSFSNGKFALATAITSSFLFKDNMGNAVHAQLASPTDSALFYIEIPATAAGTFWQASSMSQYNLKFVNTSNLLWFAQRKNGIAQQEQKPAQASNISAPVMFPNPSTGIINCMQNGAAVNAENINLYNIQGVKMGSFKNARQFNITNAPAGVYTYQATVNGKTYNGKIVKL